jgi:hypothetical protein
MIKGKKYLRSLTILTLAFIILCSTIPLKANAASSFTGNKWNKSIVSIYIDDTPYPSQGGTTIPSYYYIFMHSNSAAAIERWSIYWNNVWRANLHFIYADTASNADIVIKYGRPSSWAQTKPTAISGIFQKVNIVIDDWAFYSYSFDIATQTNIVAHELGHALGLADIREADAANAGIFSIMVNSVYPPSAHFSQYPTEFDRKNIFSLY